MLLIQSLCADRYKHLCMLVECMRVTNRTRQHSNYYLLRTEYVRRGPYNLCFLRLNLRAIPIKCVFYGWRHHNYICFLIRYWCQNQTAQCVSLKCVITSQNIYSTFLPTKNSNASFENPFSIRILLLNVRIVLLNNANQQRGRRSELFHSYRQTVRCRLLLPLPDFSVRLQRTAIHICM